MNGICQFRVTSLTDEELLKAVDKKVDQMYEKNEVPARHIPARPDEDLDILIGELLLRFKELLEKTKE